jgi:predicted ATP-grasp superfamily ATP-dependent carboligase
MLQQRVVYTNNELFENKVKCVQNISRNLGESEYKVRMSSLKILVIYMLNHAVFKKRIKKLR